MGNALSIDGFARTAVVEDLTVGFEDEFQRFKKIVSYFPESSPLGVYAWNLLDETNVPLSTLLNMCSQTSSGRSSFSHFVLSQPLD